MNELLKEVNSSDIFSAGKTLHYIVELINSVDSSIFKIKSAIEVDPPLVAKILKVSNSAHYGVKSEINEIEKAIVWLGFNTVRDIALRQKTADMFQSEEKIFEYSRSELWKQNLLAAMVNRDIQRKELGQRGEHAYVSGLLHQLGIIVFEQFRKADFKKILEISHRQMQNIIDVEQEILGFNHAEFGTRMLESWKIAPEVSVPVRYYHTPLEAPFDFVKSTCSLFLAHSICHLNSDGFTDTPDFDERMFNTILDKTNINYRALQIIYDDTSEIITQMQEQGII